MELNVPSPDVGSPPVVRLHGVQKGYREGDRRHPVLVGVDLAIRGNETVALLGPSGSGKSTLLNLVGGIDLPDGGEVWVGGERLDRMSEAERTIFRRRHIGFVFQFFNLIPTLTVEENLLLPLELRGRLGSEERGRVRNLLDAVGLECRARSFPDRLSGGERQRVAVVRALVHQPLLVLADEPTGSLDESAGEGVLRLLEELVAEEGGALVLVTHSREVASRADRILRLRSGRLHGPGDPGREDPIGAPDHAR